MWIVFFLGLAIGIGIGLYFGGGLALRRLTEFEHKERRRRAGLSRRS